MMIYDDCNECIYEMHHVFIIKKRLTNLDIILVGDAQ